MRENLTYGSMRGRWGGPLGDHGKPIEALAWKRGVNKLAKDLTTWEILLHLVNHSTDHRLQILSMINSYFDIGTPEQDYIIYLWEKR
jgi:hypothetical protein